MNARFSILWSSLWLSKKLIYCILGFVMLSSLSGCDDDEEEGGAEVRLSNNAALGTILTDKNGRTLYYFTFDATAASTCTGACESLWPVFNVEGLTAAKLDAGLSESDFTTITHPSGKPQLTYKGRPLYYYAPFVNGAYRLEEPGQTTGENVDEVWFVAKTDYTIGLTDAQLVGADGKNYLSTYVEGVGKTQYFTDGKGVTLYTFTNDRQNKNNFTNSTFSNNANWPIYETDQAVVPSHLDKTLFGVIDVFGRKQLTYKGWPLYYYGTDAGVMGSNKGVSVPTPGRWPVAVKNMAAAVPQ